MTLHITDHRGGFGPGLTEITRLDDPANETGIGFAVLKLATGETVQSAPPAETAWLLMEGRLAVEVDGRSVRLERASLFDESSSALHVAADESVRLTAESDVELTVYQVANTKPFAARIFTPRDVPDEHRGAGQVGGACLRYVRTIFDGSTTDANSEMVLGEVVGMPGKWSSYPPHHHPQPEIYHYRFSDPRGFGFAQMGDEVVTVRPFDTVKILSPNDHAQVAAPGYAIYYAWVIRHLPGNRYTVPEFTEAHRWTMEKDAAFWNPADE